MKKLSLLIFAIMILGCGTERPVVEESESPTEGLNEDLTEIQNRRRPTVSSGGIFGALTTHHYSTQRRRWCY